ncbi:MAG: cob(I)yrinic acid a,c-diamide adenosyltransferase [Hyphomicrobiales bacterium]|nr:cob(I)yrinic acid a,c-diamide adenosyltransferase [Hyphomicrobiales bacterium]
MVILNKIYTKTGDDGTTALGSGARRKKFDLRVSCYGAVDETNAAIGVARLYSESDAIDTILELIQNDLFDLGADLSVPDDNHGENSDVTRIEPLRIDSSQVGALEAYIDQYNGRLEPLRSFILSGGNALAAHLHLARTISRRAERGIVELSQNNDETVNPMVIIYMNRLSDLLFVLARHANDLGRADVLWIPGKNRY